MIRPTTSRPFRLNKPRTVRRSAFAPIAAVSVALAFAAVVFPQASPASPPASPAPADHAAIRAGLAWQIAMDRAGFSPGLLDGSPGRKTRIATAEYQAANGMKATGNLDEATAAALGVDPAAALTTYTVTQGDLDQIGGPLPKKWVEKSRLKTLAYETLDAQLAEKFHCTRALLSLLNGGKDIAALKPGDTINVPAVAADPPIAGGQNITINFAQKIVRIFSKDGKLVGMFHCSIAADEENLPSVPKTAVAVITPNPEYRFDPKKWPEVKDVHQILMIPPGPRNPVGVCWMGLGLPGYGMHGSPTPEMIGKTGSHGCFRLTNWDAIRLSGMLKVGTPVEFVKGGAATP